MGKSDVILVVVVCKGGQSRLKSDNEISLNDGDVIITCF